MIYGVPCCDGEEDNPIITEEKVISNNKQYIWEIQLCIIYLVKMEYGWNFWLKVSFKVEKI